MLRLYRECLHCKECVILMWDFTCCVCVRSVLRKSDNRINLCQTRYFFSVMKHGNVFRLLCGLISSQNIWPCFFNKKKIVYRRLVALTVVSQPTVDSAFFKVVFSRCINALSSARYHKMCAYGVQNHGVWFVITTVSEENPVFLYTLTTPQKFSLLLIRIHGVTIENTTVKIVVVLSSSDVLELVVRSKKKELVFFNFFQL